MRECSADVVVVGASLGGVAAALAVASMGYRVVLSEPTAWLGGQLTSQAVPPDEAVWIETRGFGATRRYREFRQRVRQYYRSNYPITESARRDRHWNPGSSWVSRLAHEPKVALRVLTDMLAPYENSGRLVLYLQHRPTSVEVDGDRVRTITLQSVLTDERVVVSASYALDGTECGDLLPLAGAEYVTGSESQAETGEAHAGETAEPLNMQAATWVAAIEYCPQGDYTMAEPTDYHRWRTYQPSLNPPWPGPWFSWEYTDPISGQATTRSLFGATDAPNGPGGSEAFWQYRRIIDAAHFGGLYGHDISLINWPQNDYVGGVLFEVNEEEARRHWSSARQLTLSWLYWLKTEAPRADGGRGYPELRLRPDVLGGDDGLALSPYIRESRRIRARFTILEQHLARAIHPAGAAPDRPDSVGIGYYPIDLHPTTGGKNSCHVEVAPFQIPLGSLIPVRMENLLPAAKNIGTTHVTNGCYRVHPVEWNIGEAAGYLVGYCLRDGLAPAEVWEHPAKLKEFQRMLKSAGIRLKWPSWVP